MLREVVFAALFGARLMAGPPIRFEGSVRAGESFRKEIGSGLVFVLSGEDDGGSGWSIEVRPRDDSDNFVRCVILPLHGPTPADIMPSQFVTEENEELPAADAAAVKTRQFQFVLNPADQKNACGELDAVAYGPAKTASGGTVILGTPGYRSPPLGEGIFQVKALELSDVGRGGQAVFKSMSFSVELRVPSSRRSRAARGHQ
jgi:hypothetical protein